MKKMILFLLIILKILIYLLGYGILGILIMFSLPIFIILFLLLPVELIIRYILNNKKELFLFLFKNLLWEFIKLAVKGIN